MIGGSKPFVPPLLAAAARSIALREMKGHEHSISEDMEADPRSSDAANLEVRDHNFTAADEYAEYSPTPRSPVANNSAFQTPTTIVGTNTSADFSEDIEMLDDEADKDNQQADSHEIDPSVAATMSSAQRKLRSRCWKEFVPVMEDGVIIKGKCKHCDLLIGAGKGTSSMLTHLKRCKKRSRALQIVEDLSSTLRSPSGARLKDWQYDPQVSRNQLARMVALHELPFMFVEYSGFRSFVESLNPLFKVPSRGSLKNHCMKDFSEKKSELQRMFKNSNCRFSLTTDMWTSNQTLGYICVTCHFIDDEWKLQKRIIKYIDVKTPHTGAELFNNILNCIQDWGIEDKLFGITLDNASANDTMIDLLRTKLVAMKLLPSSGELFHHRCAGHVINLIVQDGLKFLDSTIENIRESVKYIRSSQSRKQMFKEIIAQEGIENKKLPSLDVSTRWNSTFAMLERAIALRGAFESLELQDKKYTSAPSSQEWTKAEVLCRLLEEFNKATELISGSHYPTSNLYFHQMWKIKILLEKVRDEANAIIVAEIDEASVGITEERDEANVGIAAIVKGMQKKFAKYWKLSYISFCLPVIFDPRYKLKFIEFLFTSSFPKSGRAKLNTLESVVRRLFSAYCPPVDANPSQDRVNDRLSATTSDDPWAAWDQQLTVNMQAQVSTELDRYLDESPIPRSQEFDILQWWRSNNSKYPVLARIARDVLAVPASSVASEAAFSTGKRIISDFRSSLAPETVEALICLQDWYRAAGSAGFSLASIHETL